MCSSDLFPSHDSARKVSVSRELSKLHEETARGTVVEVAQYFEKKGVKGEIVVVVEGKGKPKPADEDEED